MSNGRSTFVGGVDERSELARRYRDLCSDLKSHLGGNATATEQMIIRRVASIAVWCEQQEARQAAGEAFDVAAYTTAANSLRRLLADLGLQMRLKDVTPSLSEYLTTRRRQSNG